MRKPLTGIGTQVRFVLRRDRVRIPIWIIGIVGFVVAVVDSWTELFPTRQDRQARAELMDSPMMTVFNGPGYGLDDYTIGAMAANELLILAAIAAALMSILLVVRHTRAEEESGRTELVRASVVGPLATTVAVLVVVWTLNLAIGLLIALGLSGSVDELGMEGSLAFGLSVASVGMTFAAVAAVTAQLTQHSRGANGMAAALLAVAFVLRAVGDVGDRTLSWLSPIGWAQATRAFVDERWWPLLLSLGLTLVLTLLAMTLTTRRDFGASMFPQRPGSPTASKALASPVGLALRLQRGSLVGWGTGLLLGAVAFGAVASEVTAFAEENPQLAEFIAAIEGVTLLESFLGLFVLLLALLATCYAVQAMLRSRSEETEGRAEPLLATPLSRSRWASSHLVVALLGGTFVLLLGTLGLGVTAAADQSEWSLVGELLGAGLAYVPAMWLTIGVVAALFGLVPRAAALGWAVVAYAIFVGLFGDVLQLPDGMHNLSPFHHVPNLPGAELTLVPLVVLSAVAAVLTAIGLGGLRRRDVWTT